MNVPGRPGREKKKDFPACGTAPGRKVLLPPTGRAPPDSSCGIGMLTVRLTTTPFSTRNYTMILPRMQDYFEKKKKVQYPVIGGIGPSGWRKRSDTVKKCLKIAISNDKILLYIISREWGGGNVIRPCTGTAKAPWRPQNAAVLCFLLADIWREAPVMAA